jgi:protein ImuA
MQPDKSAILAKLQKEILPLQGIKLPANGNRMNTGLGTLENAFPNSCFPVGAVHEFICTDKEETAATIGFIAGVLASFMQNTGVSVWISTSRMVFPPGLKVFGIEPDKIIFVDVQKEKDLLWVMEETLKCTQLAAVVGEIREINFKASRRLQLAVEKSGVTGFILHHSYNLNTIASVCRWKISPIPSELENGIPGVGFSRWNVELLKIRNGKPGTWQIEWSAGKFRHISPLVTSILEEQKRKTG